MQTFDMAPTTVRTVLNLAPSVAAAALVCAQGSGLRVQEWLDKVVLDACASAWTKEHNNSSLKLTDQAVVDLFACVAVEAPHLLPGRWSILLAHAKQEETLWSYPRLTVGEIEDGVAVGICDPSVNIDALRRKWPRLLAAAFVS